MNTTNTMHAIGITIGLMSIGLAIMSAIQGVMS